LKAKLQFLKFISVGAIGTALHYAVLIILVTILGIDPAMSAMVGATFGAVLIYCLNYRFTFHTGRPHVEALPRFIAMAVIGVFLNGLIVKTLTLATINYLIGQMVATVVILILNFFLSKLWIFKQSR